MDTKLRQVFHEQLTKDQETAIVAIERFLASDQHCFILKGHAGTGKTYLLGGFLRYLRSIDRMGVLFGPTGRSALILARKAGLEASTIHHGIYTYVDTQVAEDHYQTRFVIKVNRDALDTVYVIDEASLISPESEPDALLQFGSGNVLKDLVDHINPQGTKRKIIYVGDEMQLSPGQAAHGPALDGEYLGAEFGLSCAQERLSEVVRQAADSGIHAMSSDLRDQLMAGQINRFSLPKERSDLISEDEQSSLTAFAANWSPQQLEDRICIAYSNRQVLAMNKAIRLRLFPGRTGPGPDDRIMITRSRYWGVRLYSGQFCRLLKVEEPKVRTVPMTVKGGATDVVELRFRDVVMSSANEMGVEAELKLTILENTLEMPDNEALKRLQRALFVDFKNRHKELKTDSDAFLIALRGDPYINATFLQYGYAITGHKALGGEWDVVHLDLRTSMPVLSKGFLRWAYTGVTRARRELWLVGTEEKTPFSELHYAPIKRIARPLGEQLPAGNDEPCEVAFPHAFQRIRYNHLAENARQRGWQLTVRQLQYADRYQVQAQAQIVELDLAWGNKGHTGSIRPLRSATAEFDAEVLALFKEAPHVAFQYTPSNETYRELYEAVYSAGEKCDCSISNVVEAPYYQRYFVRSEASCAGIDFHHDANRRFGMAEPFSTMGEDDVVLHKLIDALQ